MKTVILAGGLGTRLAEETEIRPKPMVEIGEYPILWHILKLYAHHGHKEFLIALGYKGEVIKHYFLDYHSLSGDMTVKLASGKVDVRGQECDDWMVHLVHTGHETNTGGRIKRLARWLSDGPFMATYGDGVSDVNVDRLLAFHKAHGRLATVTAVRPPARFGRLDLEGDLVRKFAEKPQAGEGWINGGFMVFEPEVLAMLEGDMSSLEGELLERLAGDGQLAAYRHDGFWQCMDTLRDKRQLDAMWKGGRAPWKVWT